MVSSSTTLDLIVLPRGFGKRYQLLSGRIIESPARGWQEGQIVHNVHRLLGCHIQLRGLGRSFASGTGFCIERCPDSVLAPAFAFVAHANAPSVKPEEFFWPGAPDLAVEVLSPGDSTREVDEKINAWLAAGCAAVWIIDPRLKTVTTYRSRTDATVRTVTETLDGGDVVPGFSCAVAELFC